MKYGKQFPFAYCVLPGKSRGIYLRTFELVKQKSRNLGYLIYPAEILTDFELAIHFTQAVDRNISKLDLQIAYREDASFCCFILQTVELAFVKATAPNLPRVDKFITYFE